MVEIDLHGLKHKEVEDTLESMLISYYNLGLYQLAEQDYDKACSLDRGYCNLR